MVRFRILFGVNLLILLFQLWEWYMMASSSLTMTSADGQTTIIPRDRWLLVSPILAAIVFVVAILGGALMLRGRGRIGWATLLLLVPIVVVILGLLPMVALMIIFTLGTPQH